MCWELFLLLILPQQVMLQGDPAQQGQDSGPEPAEGRGAVNSVWLPKKKKRDREKL